MVTQSRREPAPPFLLTRPAAQGDRFADQLRARFGDGIRVVSSPLIAPRYIASHPLDASVRGLIFTSETAVAAFRRISAERSFSVWCVGDRTAAAAREAGFVAQSARGDAEALVAAILASGDRGPLLHLRGQETRGDLAERLRSSGIETNETVVYVQEPRPLTVEAIGLLCGMAPVAVPLFSPRTATLFAEAVAALQGAAPLWIAALSPAVASAAATVRAARLATAPHPDAESLLNALEGVLAAPTQP